MLLGVKIIHPKSRADWRKWLEAHHATESEVWLRYEKKHTGRRALTWSEAVQEALCFGWIDTTVKRESDESYVQRFTPRKKGSKWSAVNQRHAKKLIEEGLMTDAGLVVIDWTPPKKRVEALPKALERELKKDKTAWKNFNDLPRGQRLLYVRWIAEAKREETQLKRLSMAIEKLRGNARRWD
jgi:uncharacterized protein YdeI (YjbR/CyaY-like superfamily)